MRSPFKPRVHAEADIDTDVDEKEDGEQDKDDEEDDDDEDDEDADDGVAEDEENEEDDEDDKDDAWRMRRKNLLFSVAPTPRRENSAGVYRLSWINIIWNIFVSL